MTTEVAIALLIVASGTFLMRAVPLHWMQRHLSRRSEQSAPPPAWLGLSGPLLIAALLGVSSVPSPPSAAAWGAVAVGLTVTALVWWRYRALGIPILAGVLSYGVVIWLAAALV
ncbi:AzlD domain-containing protein [Phytohalomonas tamaricis]|uniref:AzlD domain-containing protein n=1 Tax=Phytohalomonas tamaricis TaxID=2081032 RepID=UPI000D0AF2B3|nr:AzlD domain-containing protein [Phytohalomonas tamaricis]